MCDSLTSEEDFPCYFICTFAYDTVLTNTTEIKKKKKKSALSLVLENKIQLFQASYVSFLFAVLKPTED